jgi:hypothetical protein
MARSHATLAAILPFALLAGPAQAQHYSDWGNAVAVSAVNTMGSAEGCPIESRDGLDLYVASNRPGTLGKLDIFRAHRRSKTADWGDAKPLGAPVNSGEYDYCPTPLPGKWLLFVSSRQDSDDCYPGDVLPPPPAGSPSPGDIYLSRESPAHGWIRPLHLGCFPDGPNTAGYEFSPSLVETREGTFLFFSSNGYPGSQSHDIYMSRVLDDGTVLAGTRVNELSSPTIDYMPNVRKDGLEVVLSSTRDTGNPDIYVATRKSTASKWSTPVRIGNTAINTPGGETRPSLSGDGTRLYFGRKTSIDPAGDVFVSTRRKISGP